MDRLARMHVNLDEQNKQLQQQINGLKLQLNALLDLLDRAQKDVNDIFTTLGNVHNPNRLAWARATAQAALNRIKDGIAAFYKKYKTLGQKSDACQD